MCYLFLHFPEIVCTNAKFQFQLFKNIVITIWIMRLINKK